MGDDIYYTTVTRRATFLVRAGNKASATRQTKRALEEGILDFEDFDEHVETRTYAERLAAAAVRQQQGRE